MVLVNLYHEPLGAPMTYRAAKDFFDRLARSLRLPGSPAHDEAYGCYQLDKAGVDSTSCGRCWATCHWRRRPSYLHASDEDAGASRPWLREDLAMSSPALRLVADKHEHVGPDTSWLEWESPCRS